MSPLMSVWRVPHVSVICSVFVAIHSKLLYMSLLERGTFRTFFPAYFKSPGLYLCHHLSSEFIINANICSFEGLHALRVGDCWLKCVFLGNLFTYLLWEVMLSTITNSWPRKKYVILSVSDFTLLLYDYKKIIFHSLLAKFSGYHPHMIGNIFLWCSMC